MKKLKQTCSFFYEQFYKYLLYIGKHPLSAIFLFIGIWAGFGSYAFATDYYADSEVVINIAGTTYNWLEIGRFGLVFVRRLLGTNWYNPYYTGILFLFFLWLTGMTFSYLCSKLFPKLTAPILVLGSLVFLTYPTFSEQYYFHFQSAEIAFGLWLSMLALGLIYFFIRDHRWSCFFAALPLFILTFGIYQSFVPLTLCGYLTVFLSVVTRKDCSVSTIKRGIWGSIAHFFTAFLMYEGIDKLFFTSSNYLNSQIIWTGEAPLLASIKDIIYLCVRMFLGRDIFYTAILPFAVLLTMAAFFRRKALPLPQLLLGILASIGITVCPFLLTLMMGINTAARSQFTYGFTAVILILFSMETFLEYSFYPKGHTTKTKRKWLSISAVSTAALLVYTVAQIATVRFIWHAHEQVTAFDRKTATAVMETMYDSFIVDSGIGTVLWGSMQPETDYDDILADSPSYLFRSVFNLDHNAEPYCFYSTNRVLGYMESMGHTFTFPDNAVYGVSKFIMNRENLTDFPMEGCFFNDFQAFTLNLGNCPDYYYN